MACAAFNEALSARRSGIPAAVPPGSCAPVVGPPPQVRGHGGHGEVVLAVAGRYVLGYGGLRRGFAGSGRRRRVLDGVPSIGVRVAVRVRGVDGGQQGAEERGAGPQFVHGAGVHDPAAVQRAMRSASSRVDRRWAMISVVGRRTASRSAAWISDSTRASIAEVASSSTRTAGSPSSALASATRWRWPPDSVRPCSPTTVS